MANRKLKWLKKLKLLYLKTIQDKTALMSYADFESNLVPQNNGNQNPDEPYINKYQNHVGCSFGYKLACVDDHFSKPVK